MWYIRVAGIGASSGLVAGLLWGMGLRLAMRIMALVGGQTPEFTLEGTLLILLVGTFIGIPAGLLFVAIRKYLPGSGGWKGLVFGLLVVLVLGYPFYAGPLKDEAVPGYEIQAFMMFEGLLAGFGMAVAAVAGRLEQYIPPVGRSRFSTALSAGTLAVPCSIEALIVALMILKPFE